MSVKHIKYVPIGQKGDVPSEVPNRNSFCDPKRSDEISEAIRNGDKIAFMPIDPVETTEVSGLNKKYALYLFGILSDGSKAMVVVNDVDISFEVKVEKLIEIKNVWDVYRDENRFKMSSAEFINFLRPKFQEHKIHFKKIEPTTGNDLKHHQTAERQWIKISFENLTDREKALKYVTGLGYTTAEDDTKKVFGPRQGFYFSNVARKICFNTSAWNYLLPKKYSVTRLGDHNHKSPKCKYVFSISAVDIVPVPDDDINKDDLLVKDRTMVATLDIETWRSKAGGEVPKPDDRDYVIFMICMTFHWKNSNNALMKLCLVDMPTKVTEHLFYDPDDVAKAMKENECDETTAKQILSKNNIVIECGSERNVLLALCDVVNQMSPDVYTAFNGSNFDWPLIREQLYRTKSIPTIDGKFIDGMEYMKRSFSTLPRWLQNETPNEMMRNYFRSEKVKVSAEKTVEMPCVLTFPGSIDTDAMIIFERLYPRSEVGRGKSLNFYLLKNGIKGKEDMPYKEMFRIYERARSCVRRSNEINRGALSVYLDYLPLVIISEGAIATNQSIIELENIVAKIKTIPKEKYTTEDDMKVKECDKIINQAREAIVSGVIKPLNITDSDIIITAMDLHDVECATSKEEMELVGKYCVVDAFRCQQLYTKRTIVADHAEFANMSYVSLYDALYRANGVKVEQLVGKMCVDTNANFNIKFTKITPTNIRMKYPGAYVFVPIKGLNVRRPVVGLDFASLYPSLMMAYNLSPDMIVESEAEALRMAAEGYVMLPVEFEAEVTEEEHPDKGTIIKQRAWIVRHNGIIDPSVDKEVKGKDLGGNWIVRNTPLPGERMGIFPYILKDLFAHRKVIKTRFVALSTLKELMLHTIEHNNLSETNKDWSCLPISAFKDTGLTPDMSFDVDEVDFRIASADSKQKGRKIHMNTFYGVQGYNKSCIYKLAVAGAITQYGQYNIQLVAKFCAENGYTRWYGDTDSVYISSPDHIFKEVDDAFAIVDTAHQLVLSQIGRDSIDSRAYKKRKVSLDPSIRNGVGSDRVFDSKFIREQTTAEAKLYFGDIIAEYKHKHSALLDALKESGGHSKQTAFETFTAENRANFTMFCKNMKAALIKYANECFAADDSLKAAEFAKECLFLTKEEYWIQMVQITRRDIDLFKGRVNDMLYNDNGTRFLNMAYEEVLFPVMFFGKKRYTGIPHLEGENFHPKPTEYFVRGMEHIKQGKTLLAKDISEQFIKRIFSIRNEDDPFEIVKQQIKRIYNEEWPVNYFISRAKFKPEKRNIPVQRFVQRMKEAYEQYSDESKSIYNPELAALYLPPEPGDPFEYVVVEKEQQYDLRGRMIKLGKGDCYEYVGIYKHYNTVSLRSANNLAPNASHREEANIINPSMSIDLEHYVNGAMQGILARFVTYREEFATTEEEYNTMSEREADEKSMKRASSWVKKYCVKISKVDTGRKRTTGAALRSLFRAREKIDQTVLKRDLKSRYGDIGEFIGEVNIVQPTPGDTIDYKENREIADRNVESLLSLADEKAKKIPKYVEEYVKNVHNGCINDPDHFYRIWKQWRPDKVGATESVFMKRMDACQKSLQENIKALKRQMPAYMSVIGKYDQKFNNSYDVIRNRIIATGENDFEEELLNYANELDHETIVIVKSVKKIFDDILANKVQIDKLSKISTAMHEEKYRRVSSNNQSPRLNVKQESKGAEWKPIEDTSFA
jgi:DNA polymerase elongation subunit (family B)